MADRFTGIDGDQITDGTIQPNDLLFDIVPLAENIVIVKDIDTFKSVSLSTLLNSLLNTQYSQSLGETSTTSTAYQDKLLLTFTPPLAGIYRISWHIEVATSIASKDTYLQVLQDATSLSTIRKISSTGYPNFDSKSGFAVVSLLTQSYTFTIQFRNQATNYTSYLKNCTLLAQRIA